MERCLVSFLCSVSRLRGLGDGTRRMGPVSRGEEDGEAAGRELEVTREPVEARIEGPLPSRLEIPKLTPSLPSSLRPHNQNPHFPILPSLPRRSFHPSHRTPHPPRSALVLLDDPIPTSRSKLDLPSLSRFQDRETDDRLREEFDGVDGRRSRVGRGCWGWGCRKEQRERGRRRDERSPVGVSVRRIVFFFFLLFPSQPQSLESHFLTPSFPFIFRSLSAISDSTTRSKLSPRPTLPLDQNSSSPLLLPCPTVPLAPSSPSTLQVRRRSSFSRREEFLEPSRGICLRSGTRGRRGEGRLGREELGNRWR